MPNKINAHVFFLVFAMSFLNMGCATIGSITKNYKNIVFNDGISKQEAVAIAQHEIIQSDNKFAYQVNSAQAYPCDCRIKDGDEKIIPAWAVIFKDKVRLVPVHIKGIMGYIIDRESGIVLGKKQEHGGFIGLLAGIFVSIFNDKEMKCSIKNGLD